MPDKQVQYEVLLRVEGGHIHRATKVGGGYRVDERCNVDDALDKHEVSSDELANVETWALCQQPTCFPDIPAPEDEAA